MFSAFRKIEPFLRPQWRLLLVSLILSIPMSAISSSPAFLVKVLIDRILVQKPADTRVLVYFSAGIVGIFLLNMVVRFFFAFSARLANERVMRDIRERVFSHFVGLSIDHFTSAAVGEMMVRVKDDGFYVSHALINLASLIRQSLTFLAMFGYAIYLNPKLMLLALTVAPLIVWLTGRSTKLVRGYAQSLQAANGRVSGVLQESLAGVRTIQSFCLEGFARDRFKYQNDQYVDSALKAARVEEIVAPSIELSAALAIAMIIYVGGQDVVKGVLTPGELGAFFASFALMVNPLKALSDLNLKFAQAGAAADRIHQSLSLHSRIQPSSHPRVLSSLQKALEFRGLGFHYGQPAEGQGVRSSESWVFRDLSFSLPKGATVALVGPSGQGKSTLVNLIPRFYDPAEGDILWDGVSLKDADLKSLRSQVALVSQDIFLFNDTVWMNLTGGRQDLSEASVRRAAEAAQCLDFIQALPEGFQTILGERGQRLSGGERQRLAIARAILKDAPVLILDEATSNLDAASEKAVQQALENLMVGRTTLVIAHRLSTIQRADEILVLNQGRIEERGRHDQLMARGGLYARYQGLLLQG